MRKPRILWCAEASYLSTGYSTYTLEVLKRLHKTGKYEIAEFAAYGDAPQFDPRAQTVPWAFFPNMPARDNPAEKAQYEREYATAQFGSWRFEKTCLAWRPDIVVDIRDHWMMAHEETSPFRPFYHWVIMPTVDAAPQPEEWLATYMNADGVFTYSDWGKALLYEQTQGRMKVQCSAPPGADLDTLFVAEDPGLLRDQMGIPREWLIIGTVMRNQSRKLYPNLIRDFEKLVRQAPESIARRLRLYLHTAYPDTGWNIPQLIKESEVGHRILLTYRCKACGSSFPNFSADGRAVCRFCNQMAATMPNSEEGVSRAILAKIMNLFDAYVQYANSEGFGMPMVEAAACGIPVFAVDYSAMSDVVRKLQGFPLKVKDLRREPETHCYRAIPCGDDFVEQLKSFIQLPSGIRRKHGRNARRGVEEHYTYDKTAKLWENYLDQVPLRPHIETWDSPARLHQPVRELPMHLPDEEFVRWGMVNIAGRPDLAHSYLSLRILRDLQWGMSTGVKVKANFSELSFLGQNVRPTPYSRLDCANELAAIAEWKNQWEEVRTR